jgi:NTE family protein
MLMPRRFGFDADFCMRSDQAVMQRLQAAFGDRRIEDLPLPLRITASEAATGRTIVIREGRLVDALRASIALPFMFKPGVVNGQRLIDGFVSDPLPVGAAADADAVIAVGFPVPMPSRIDGPSRLLAQLTSAMTNNLMEARLGEARAHGRRLLALQPGLPRRVGLFETAAMQALVAAGRELARAEAPAIQALLRAPLAKAA